MATEHSKSFLFVCTGNICRSPLAELAMRREAERRGLMLDIDSAATGRWNLGDAPDPRAQRIAARNGLDASSLRSRLVAEEDFRRFDHIVALDRSHFLRLAGICPEGATSRLSLLLDHLPGREGEEVIDPYYGPESGFEITWEEVRAACAALAEKELGPA